MNRSVLSPTLRFSLIIILACGLSLSAFADEGVTVYKPGSNGKVTRGCVQVTFIMQGVFSGTIGNATFSTAASTQTVIPIQSYFEGQRLGEIPYTLAGAGSLIIVEVR